MTGSEGPVTRALSDLTSDVALVRRYAVRELGRWGDARVLAPLQDIQARDPEAQIRAEAAKAVDAIRLRVAAAAIRGDKVDPASVIPPEAHFEEDRRGTGVVPLLGDLRTPGSGRIKMVDSQADTVAASSLGEAAPARSAAENLRELMRVRTRSKEEAATDRRRLLDEALIGLEVPVTPKPYGFKLDVPLIDGRRQFVRIAYEQSDFENDKIMVVFSPCGPAKEKLYRWALELNHRLTYGKVGVHTPKDGGQEFVMSAALVEATADPIELRKAVLAIAEKADRIEKLFWDEDRL
jgi:hypothetical protein